MPSKKPRNREQVCDLLFFLRFFTAYAKMDSGDIMLGDRIPFEIFRQMLIDGDQVYECQFYIEDNNKFEDCWIGFNADYDEPYWFGLPFDEKNDYDYKTADEILNAKVFDGKSLKDLWDQVYFYSINGISANDWVVFCCVDYYLCRERDAAKVASLAVKLWRDADHEELKREFETLVKTEDNIIFTAYFQNEMIAFAHCAIRHEYVEGAHSDDVGYLEAVYVEEQFRNLGIASYLMEYCENWAGSKGCKQFASDCEINNSASVALHRKYGFAESARLVHFIKDI